VEVFDPASTRGPWDRMKPLGSYMTTERANRRKEREFRTVLEKGDFSGLGKDKDKL
jgi:hypothetical protein